MACHCHGKDGKSVIKTSAYDQCTTCARKHTKNAWSKWNEFTYEEDNREYVSAQLRDAADHLKFTYRDTALELRDLAVAIEEWKDDEYGDIAIKIDELRKKVLQIFLESHPEINERKKLFAEKYCKRYCKNRNPDV